MNFYVRRSYGKSSLLTKSSCSIDLRDLVMVNSNVSENVSVRKFYLWFSTSHICFVLFSKTLIMFIARSVMFFWAIMLCLYLHRRAVMKILVVLSYYWSDSNGIKHIKLKFDYHNMGQKVCYERNPQCLSLTWIWRWWNTLWIKCLFVLFLLRKYKRAGNLIWFKIWLTLFT